MILLSRAVARTTAGLPRPQVLPGTTYIAGCYRCHRLDSVRQFNIRAVTVTEGPYKSIPKPTPSFQALLRDEWSKEQATVPAGDLLHFTPRQGASVDSVKIVEEWRSGLILPPGEYGISGQRCSKTMKLAVFSKLRSLFSVGAIVSLRQPFM